MSGSWSNYLSIGKVAEKTTIKPKESYSVTSDILSFQRCPRQYGFFAIKKYQPAHIVQIWFGTIIHQVLNKLHLHYRGLLNPSKINQVPSDEEVIDYFNQVESSLKAKGIKAITTEVATVALKVLILFNRIEGPTLYPNVKDTECDLQADQKNYIFHGVVDVLKNIFEENIPEGYEPVEIWDYKGSKLPDTTSKGGASELERYRFQMLCYAQLYKKKTGKYPIKGILYYMNELNIDPEPSARVDKAIIEIDFRDSSNFELIEKAMKSFGDTVAEIEICKETDTWEPTKDTDKETCDICDLRWNCAKVNYQMRYP